MTAIVGSKSIIERDCERPEVDMQGLSLQEIVKTPKYKEFLEKFKLVGKTELHAHLGGAVSLEFIREHCSPQEYVEIVGFIEKIKEGVNYAEGFKAFPMIGKALNTNQHIEEAAFDFCQSQYNDKVTFSELRTGLKRLNGGFEEYLKSVLRGLDRGRLFFGVEVSLVLSLRRDTTVEDANEIIDLAIKYKGLVEGIDISGESTKGNASGIFDALKRAKEAGFPITLHIGENPQESAEQQLKELNEIQPERVGHAVHLCNEAMEWIKSRRTVVEACIRSALSVDMISTPGDHPALELFKNGHPVVFCTDDSTLFGDLSEELALVACLCDLSLEEMIELQAEIRKHAFRAI